MRHPDKLSNILDSSNPKNIPKTAKKNYKKLYTTKTTSKAAINEFLSKLPNWKEISNEQFNLWEVKIFLDEIIKSINSQTNSKSRGN